MWFLATLLTVSLAGAQPVPVQDVFPQSSYYTVYNGSRYLWASSAATGNELWKSDLAGSSFELVKEFVPGPEGTPTGVLFVLNGVLCLETKGVLYRSDGTAAGTSAIGNTGGGLFEQQISFNGSIYFAAGTSGNRELWKTNGTAAGTGLVKDINPGAVPSYPHGFRVHNGTLYFVADHATYGTELWKSDGTAAGTVLVKDIYPGAGSSNPTPLTMLGGQLFFGANDGTHGTEFWKTNGTAAGTVLVKDINPGPVGSGPGGFTSFNGKLYFGAGESENGYEPWVSDGTAAGTLLLEDLNPYYVYEPEPYGGPASSAPGNFQVVNGDLYFQAAILPDYNPNDGAAAHASEYEMPQTVAALYAVRGATGKLTQVFVSQPAREGISASISSLTNVNGTLYFTTYSSWPTITPNNKLYASDGTTTRLLKDFARSRWVQPSELTPYNGVVYFVADDGVSGSEIWKTDGTVAGTGKLIEAVPGPNGTDPSYLFTFGNSLYFANGADGGRLWKYDLSKPQPTPLRINAGGPAHTQTEYLENYSWDVPGDYFGPDAYFTGGTAAESFVNLPHVYDPTLYYTERRGEFSYNIPVPRGKYTVVLHFAELYWGTDAPGGVGSRQFHINMEGVRRYTNFDIYARGGPLDAVVESITLDVLDGTLNIQFLKGAADQPQVCALEILPVTPDNRPPVLAGIGNKSLALGQSLSFKASATDADGHALSYSLAGAPAGATINPGTGAFAWTPSASGTYAFWVRVSDNAYTPATDEEKITVTVTPAAAGTYRVNAGGNSYTTPDARSFTGDAYFSGGTVSGTTTKDIAGTGDDYLYQTGRHGTSFSYNFPTGNGSYDVVLHFAETYFGNTAPGGMGSRKFHVNMEGARKLTDYDIFARAGGALRVAQETFRVTVSDGTLNVAFLKGSADNPAVKAIEVLPAGSALTINSGGAAFTSSTGKKYSADVYYASGSVSSITSGEIANTSDDALYRNARVGVFSYGLPSGNGTFDVTLHFAETYWGSRVAGGAGSRKFNVYLENVKRLSDYDVFAKAGGAMRAVKETIRVTVSDGVLNLYFAKGTADNPLVSAIEVVPAAAAAREASAEAGDGQVRLFPNPVRDKLFVTLPFPAAQIQSTAVTDNAGRVHLLDAHRADGENGLAIPAAGLHEGFYLLRLDGPQGTQVVKFLKQ